MTHPYAGAPAPVQPVQPLLSDAVIVLRAPTQVWSSREGDLGSQAIDGVYHGDVRHIRALALSCDDSAIEWISTTPDGPSRVVFGGLLRGLDDVTPDPKVRILRDRRVADGYLSETWTVRSHLTEPRDVTLALRVEPEFGSLHDVKAGIAEPQPHDVRVTDASATARAGAQSFTLSAETADVTAADGALTARWRLRVEAGGEASVSFTVALHDETLVVRGPATAWSGPISPRPWTGHPRLDRWLDVGLGDLDALRLTTRDGADEFFAAGAPWFFTLFGRDSLWAARLALPLDWSIAASTLRVLAGLQATDDDPVTAQEPGKILHELRSTALEIPGEDVVLPPLYYGSVDSTPLWVCLLADAWRAGMPDAEVRALLPALRGALTWIIEHGDSDGDGFLDYIDRSGRGLANQGWKDSGDSIQWRDGRLAEGPIALCEVQGYAYEAALAGAELLARFAGDSAGGDRGALHEHGARSDHDNHSDRGAHADHSDHSDHDTRDAHTDRAGGDPLTPEALRAWAAALRTRFREAYWVETPEGRYPAIALDRAKRPVDTLTSNIGHLLGTGILDADEERAIAELLLGDSMSSGFGIRTMSTGADGYWPLSYHGGSVWVHDTAIVARGMRLAGLDDAARAVAGGLLAAADGFAYRVPELHSGDPATESSAPTPYPAACRPQAWSAAAAVECLEILRER